jgi:VWFA-related protein
LHRTLKAALVLVCALTAQERPSFRSRVELVTIPCTVVDARGEVVADLTREDFRVFDNGVPRIVEHLWTDEQPLTLAVLLDASQSQRDQLEEHRRTAGDLLRRILRLGDHAFIVAIDEDIRLWDDLDAGSGPVLGEPCPKQASNGPGVPPISICGSSPLWNAVYETARLKLAPAAASAKAILMLTDGFDTGSTHRLLQAIEQVQRADAAVYAIQYPGALGGRYAPDLYRLAGATAGTWFAPPKGNYDPIVSRLETDLRRRYVLGFRPEKLSFNKSRHELRIEVGRPGLTVRARKTYFDPGASAQ